MAQVFMPRPATASAGAPDAVGSRAGQRPDFDYGSIPSGYYDSVFRRRSGVQSKWHHAKFARIRAEMGSYESHLDIGCGPGTFIGTLAPDRNSTGVDIASDQVVYAQRTHGTPEHRFRHIQPGQLPFGENSFDVVTLVELIEHLSEDDNIDLLRSAHAALRPGGRIVVSTPNYASLWPLLEWMVGRLGEVSYAEQHITHFTRPRLERLLKRAGFTGTSVDAYQWLAPFFAALNWTVADLAERAEPGALVSRVGFLLIGTGRNRS